MMQVCNTLKVDKGLTNDVIVFTLLFEANLGFSKVAVNLGISVPSKFVWSKKHEYDFDRCISNRNGRFR